MHKHRDYSDIIIREVDLVQYWAMITSSDGEVGLGDKGLWLMVAHSEEKECNG